MSISMLLGGLSWSDSVSLPRSLLSPAFWSGPRLHNTVQADVLFHSQAECRLPQQVQRVLPPHQQLLQPGLRLSDGPGGRGGGPGETAHGQAGPPPRPPPDTQAGLRPAPTLLPHSQKKFTYCHIVDKELSKLFR